MALRVQHFLATTTPRYSAADDGVPQYDQPKDQATPLAVTYGPFTVSFRNDEPIRDFLFRLVRLPIFGSGRYSATLFQVSGMMAQDRIRLATEFLVAMT
jgi:hypothetical protein